MSGIIEWLKGQGVTASLDPGGGLVLDGLDALDDATYERVIEEARTHKAEIIKELTGEAATSPGPVLPCASSKLPCLGEEGTCFGKPYWGGQAFTGEKDRHKAADLQECPYLEEVRVFQAKPAARPIVTPPMPTGRQGTRLEFIVEADPLGLRQLRDLLAQTRISLSRTPRGQLFVWMNPPLHLEALEFTALLAREVRGDLQALKDQIPVMTAAAADVLLMRVEDKHEGFGVRPGWQGLDIPNSWPPMVKVALQSMFICTAYPEVGNVS